LICAIFALLDTLAFGLTDLDEGFYASISREMIRTGNYLTPYFEGAPWFEKPPFLYWLQAGSLKILGASELATRLPSVLSFCLIITMLVWWGNRRFGKDVGTLAALIFALSPFVMVLSRLGITDMLLACCLTTALIAMWETAERPIWCILWGIATGLSILVKGPVGLGLIGLQALITFPILRNRGLKMRWAWIAFIIAVMVPIPWYAGVAMTHGKEFFQEFIVRQNLLRFAGGDTAHAIKNPILYPLYYVFILVLGIFPFSAMVLGAIKKQEEPAATYLQRWCWLVFGLFTLAITKLPAYIFPLFPALALLIASTWHKETLKSFKMWPKRIILVFGALIWTAAPVTMAVMSRNPLPVLLGIGITAMTLPFALRRHPEDTLVSSRRIVYLFAAAIVMLIGFHFTLQAYNKVVVSPVQTLARMAPMDKPLVIYKFKRGRPSLCFYRNNDIVNTDKESIMRDVLTRGGYCLAPEKSLPKGGWRVVSKAKYLKNTFVLATK
jgi:4-amino-4-deoxy-L-arabinose transferase-like glycosyltransferase